MGFEQRMNCEQTRTRVEHLTFATVQKDISLGSFSIEQGNNFCNRSNAYRKQG